MSGDAKKTKAELIEELGSLRKRISALERSKTKAASSNTLSDFLDSFPIGVHQYRIEDDGRLIFTGANKASTEILGVDTSDAYGKTIEEAYPSLAGTGIPDAYRAVVRTGIPWHEQVVNYKDNRISGAFEVIAVRTGPKTMAATFLEISKYLKAVEEKTANEQRLREERNAYQRLVQSIERTCFIYAHDTNGVFTYLSPTIEKILGYSTEEFKTHYTTYLTDSPVNKNVVMHTELSLKGERQPPYEVEIFHKDGSVRTLEVTELPILDESGKVTAIEGIARDITARKITEAAFQESEARIRAIFGHARDGIIMADIETKQFLLANNAACRMLGYTMSEMHNLSVNDIHPAENFPHVIDQFEKQSRGEIDVALNLPVKRKDGSVFYADVNSFPLILAGKKYLTGFFRDVTERRKAEEKILLSEKRFSEMNDALPLTVFEADTQGKITYVNRTGQETFGLTFSDIEAGMIIFQNIIPKDQEYARSQFRMLIGGAEIKSSEFTMIRKDGTTFPGFVTATPILHKGTITGIRGIVSDITYQKRAVETIRASEERYRKIFNTTAVALWEEDISDVLPMLLGLKANGITDIRAHLSSHPELLSEMLSQIKVMNVNEAALLMYNAKSREELIGSFDRVMLPETMPALIEVLASIAEGKEKIEVETVNRRLDDEVIDVLVSVTPLGYQADTDTILVSIMDITGQKRHAAEQLKVQKLESIGLLAGGIAHDFNNLLTAIMGNISLAKMFTQTGDPVHHRLDDAERASLSARDLTRQLLTFARGGAPVKRIASVASIITDSCTLAVRGSRSICAFSLPDELWHAEIDAGQIGQVFHNLVINAIHAMPAGGTIRISANNVEIESENSADLPEGSYIRIDVADEGSGIPAELLSKIFDPYFTTKDGGSGLGLATSHSIIRRHAGSISVTSGAGTGTTFTIFLPASYDKATPEADTAEPVQHGKGKVLIMDDEQMVRDMLEQMLTVLGYEVSTVADGAAAVVRYTEELQHGSGFDAVILDLTVPGGMGGAEAVEQLRQVDPAVCAIVSSGYSNDPVMANYRNYGFAGMIAKPYRSKDLLALLRRLLHEGGKT